MRFIAVERSAAEEIISNRFFQSTDYDIGRLFADILLRKAEPARVSSKFEIIKSNGLFFLSTLRRSPDFVIVDLETCDLFGEGVTTDDALLYFQKTLRFSVKFWNNLRPSITERMLSQSKAALFPHPISQHTSFRISVDLSPDCERQSRRPTDGRSVLVYRSGTDEGGGPNEEPSVKNFRRFLEDRRVIEFPRLDAGAGQSPEGITAIQITSLDGAPASSISAYQGFERWVDLLTKSQKKFVSAPLNAPHRIEGPAGTGKTISLILKALSMLRNAERDQKGFQALLITHSEATRRNVQQIVEANDPAEYLKRNRQLDRQSLELTTLQQLCGRLLNEKIKETEFLDRDAMESKQIQLLYVLEAIEAAMKQDYPTHKKFLSQEFDKLLMSSEQWALAEMLQHEISVVIKGRADGQLENYRKLSRLSYGLPVASDSDRGFVWTIYRRYQDQLQTSAQFDTDDIVISTIRQLDTPLWRRRRLSEGFDGIFIDECHLFNINELSLFHHLSRSTDSYPIAYSVDRAQAIGDRGWTSELFDEALTPTPSAREKTDKTEVRSIFRCSPDIVNLAFSVTSSGATLFTNFDNPLNMARSVLTGEEERKCATPRLVTCPDDDHLIEQAYRSADQLASDMGTSRSKIAIIAFADDLLKQAIAFSVAHNKAVEVVKQRGDLEVVHRAERSGRFVLSTPEYVGGLEFDGVVLVGVDDGRVPPTKATFSQDSANYLNYASHNRLYVAITRARYRVEILAVAGRGPSPLLKIAQKQGILELVGPAERVRS